MKDSKSARGDSLDVSIISIGFFRAYEKTIEKTIIRSWPGFSSIHFEFSSHKFKNNGLMIVKFPPATKK